MSDWNSTSLSQAEMTNLQQDAIRRVMEMQKRAQHSIEQTNSPAPTVPSPPPEPMRGSHTHRRLDHEVREPVLSEPIIVDAQPKPAGLLANLSSVLDGFGIENDQIIIMVLIFLLFTSSKEVDHTLLLALGYLML